MRRTVKKQILNFLRQNHMFHKLGFQVCLGYINAHDLDLEKVLRLKGVVATSLVEKSQSLTIMPKHFEAQEIKAFTQFRPSSTTNLLDISNRKFSLRNNHLFDNRLNIIDEGGMNFARMPVYQKVLSRPAYIQGTVAYLSNVDPLNFYHWMCRTLPLLRFYKNQMDEIDYFYIGEFPLKSFHRESLTQAGIQDRVLNKACTADRILAAISTRKVYYGSAPVVEANFHFTRSLFYPHCEQVNTRKRLYIQRGDVNRRKVINEKEVTRFLEKYGFEAVAMNGRSLQEQANLFYQAEAIIAPHGAALTNLLFIQPDTKVIELFPDGYINNCFYALASYSNAKYAYLCSEKLNQAHIAEHWRDISVDLQKLEQICQALSL